MMTICDCQTTGPKRSLVFWVTVRNHQNLLWCCFWPIFPQKYEQYLFFKNCQFNQPPTSTDRHETTKKWKQTAHLDLHVYLFTIKINLVLIKYTKMHNHTVFLSADFCAHLGLLTISFRHFCRNISTVPAVCLQDGRLNAFLGPNAARLCQFIYRFYTGRLTKGNLCCISTISLINGKS